MGEQDNGGDGCEGQGRCAGRGNQGGILRRLRKEMNGVVQEVVGKRRFLVRLQDMFENEIYSNQITIVVVRSEVEEEIEVRKLEMIPEVHEEFGCYHLV